MSCNPFDFVPFNNTQVIRYEDVTQAMAGSIANGIKLPRTGSNKVYKQDVQVFNAGKTDLFFYMPALYKEKKAFQTITKVTNKIKQPENCDETISQVVDSTTTGPETPLETFKDNDSVSLKVCFLATNCKTHEETSFAAADIQISGYSDKGFVYKYTIDWKNFLSFAGCMREFPIEVTDPSTPIHMNVARVANGSDFGSVHDVYFIGFTHTEDKDVWTQKTDHTQVTNNKPGQEVPSPAFTKPTLTNITPATDSPNLAPAGGTFIDNLCLGGSGPGPTQPGLSINDVSVQENQTPATFTVTCNPPATVAFTVKYQTFDGTALAGTDYLSTSGTLSFAVGDSSKDINVAIVNDTVAESPEAFTVKLTDLSTTTVTMTKDTGTCNILDDDAAGTGSCPILIIGKPSFVIYQPGTQVNFPPVVGQIPNTDTQMKITLTVKNTKGNITPPTAVGGATVAYDTATKTLTVSGPKNDVNATLTNIKFTPDASDSGDINIVGTIENLTTPGTGNQSGKFVTENPSFPAKASEAPNIEVVGTNGNIVLRVINPTNNTLVTDLYTAPVSFTTNLDATADLIVYAINQATTTPKFTAEKTALNSFKVIAPTDLGSKVNDYQVVVKSRTGDLNIQGSTVFVGGVTGSGDNKKKTQNLGDWLLNAGKGLLSGAIDGLVNDILIPKDDDTAIDDIRYYFKGCVVVPVPIVYDEINRTMVGTWDYVTFKYVFTDNPAWCALHHIQDADWGLGRKAYQLMTIDQKIQLHKDLYDVSLRCDQIIDGGPRYTINALLTNNKTPPEQLEDICSTFHGRPVWDSRNTLRIFQDRPKNPVMIVNHTSITDDGFEYSGGSYSHTHQALVNWFDPRNYDKMATTGVNVPVGIVVDEDDTVTVIGYGISNEPQAIRHGRKVIWDNSISPVAVRWTSLPDMSRIVPGDIVRILDVWTDTDYPNAQAGRCWPIDNGGDDFVSIRIDQPYKSEYIGKNIYIELDDGSTYTTQVSGGSGNTITITGSIDVDNLSGLNKYNIGDGQLILVTEVTPKRFDTGMYDVAGIYYDGSKFTAIDTGIF